MFTKLEIWCLLHLASGAFQISHTITGMEDMPSSQFSSDMESLQDFLPLLMLSDGLHEQFRTQVLMNQVSSTWFCNESRFRSFDTGPDVFQFTHHLIGRIFKSNAHGLPRQSENAPNTSNINVSLTIISLEPEASFWYTRLALPGTAADDVLGHSSVDLV
jgi:hypothetical protein